MLLALLLCFSCVHHCVATYQCENDRFGWILGPVASHQRNGLSRSVDETLPLSPHSSQFERSPA